MNFWVGFLIVFLLLLGFLPTPPPSQFNVGATAIAASALLFWAVVVSRVFLRLCRSWDGGSLPESRALKFATVHFLAWAFTASIMGVGGVWLFQWPPLHLINAVFSLWLCQMVSLAVDLNRDTSVSEINGSGSLGVFTPPIILRDGEVKGIAGWLTIPFILNLIALVWLPIKAIVFAHLLPLSVPERISGIVAHTVFFALWLYCFNLMISDRRNFPRFFLGILVAWMILTNGGLIFGLMDGTQWKPADYLEAALSVVFVLALAPYVINSKRVKNTFINGAAGFEDDDALQPTGPVGTRGWLFVLIAFLFFFVIAAAGGCIFQAKEIFDNNSDQAIGSWISLVLFALAFFSSIWAAIKLFKKANSFPSAFIAAAGLYWLSNSIAILVALDGPPQMEDYGGLVVPLVVAVIWTAYVLKSKRVRNTFNPA